MRRRVYSILRNPTTDACYLVEGGIAITNDVHTKGLCNTFTPTFAEIPSVLLAVGTIRELQSVFKHRIQKSMDYSLVDVIVGWPGDTPQGVFPDSIFGNVENPSHLFMSIGIS